MDKKGLLLCAKYAVSPNFFGYCGPDENQSLIDHLKENIADTELTNILCDFETLYPYLQLIARKNKITDPFDNRVVEAYWIGNGLLKPLTVLEHQAFAQEKLFLEKKLSKENFLNLKFKIKNSKFLPHHAFHVFNIFRRTGDNPIFHTLETMDQCRIGWGKIVQSSKLKVQSLVVKTKQLTMDNHQLALIRTVNKELKVDDKSKFFLNDVQIGNWVSFHWGFVCDKLTERQVESLEFYTQRAIKFYNL